MNLTVEKWQFGHFWQSPNMAAWTRSPIAPIPFSNRAPPLLSPPMSGLFVDAFANDAYNIPHNNILHFPQPKGPEHTISNYAHASEVSFACRSNNLFVMIRVSVHFFALFLHVICRCLSLSRHPISVRKCSICISECTPSTSKI